MLMLLKRIFFILSIILLITGKNNNGITPYGDAGFIDSGFATDITWMEYNGELYCRVGMLEGDPVLCKGVAAFDSDDQYSYELFPIEGQSGLMAVHEISRVNLYDSYSLYASLAAGSISGKYIYDFPTEGTWFSDGLIMEINGIEYCSLGTSTTGFIPGDKLCTHEGQDYYSVPGHQYWIASVNGADPERYDIYYDTQQVNALPVELLFEVNDYPKSN